MKERRLTCLLNTIILLYVWAIFSDLFSRENYKIDLYIIDDITTLVVIWLIPLTAFVILFRDQKIKQSLLDNKKELVALAMIFLAGISHRLLSIIYGTTIPASTGNEFKYEPGTERLIFAVFQAVILAVKSIGLALALQFGLKRIGVKKLQLRSWSSVWLVIAVVGFIALVVRDINALLPYFGYVK
ncbi:MAG: hypothetical protein ACOYZ6_00005 [Chloroflexota bacterium]